MSEMCVPDSCCAGLEGALKVDGGCKRKQTPFLESNRVTAGVCARAVCPAPLLLHFFTPSPSLSVPAFLSRAVAFLNLVFSLDMEPSFLRVSTTTCFNCPTSRDRAVDWDWLWDLASL